MNSRPYYAITLLLVVLVAVVQLVGTSQPAPRRVRQVALAERPYTPVAKQIERSPLYALRHRPLPQVEVVKQAPTGFFDHAKMLSAVFSVSTGGLGNPMLEASHADSRPSTEANEVVAQADENRSEVEALSTSIGFEEFIVIVNSSTVVGNSQAEAGAAEESELGKPLAADEPQFAYQMGCGMDRSTGEVYSLPLELEPQLAEVAVEVRSSTSLWTVLVRSCQAWWMQAFASSSFSSAPSVKQLMGWEFRNQILR